MEIKLSDINQFGKLDLLAKSLVEGFITGLHRSPYHGFSVEFAEHKLYNYGESTRHIDWKLYGRTDRLYTKQYEEETNLRAHILIDISNSMYYPKPDLDKIKFSVLSAASLAHLLTSQRDVVGLTTFSDKIEYESPLKSTRSHLNQIFSTLSALIDPAGRENTDIAKVLHDISGKIHRSSLVILFTDMFHQEIDLDAIFEGLQHLKHKNHEILIFHVSDYKTEKDFQFDDKPHRFIDLESGQEVKLNPNEIRSEYQKKALELFDDIKLRCGALKIDMIEVDTSDPFDKVLGAYLIKRKRMK